jgi:chromosome segregation ATPase
MRALVKLERGKRSEMQGRVSELEREKEMAQADAAARQEYIAQLQLQLAGGASHLRALQQQLDHAEAAVAEAEANKHSMEDKREADLAKRKDTERKWAEAEERQAWEKQVQDKEDELFGRERDLARKEAALGERDEKIKQDFHTSLQVNIFCFFQ